MPCKPSIMFTSWFSALMATYKELVWGADADYDDDKIKVQKSISQFGEKLLALVVVMLKCQLSFIKQNNWNSMSHCFNFASDHAVLVKFKMALKEEEVEEDFLFACCTFFRLQSSSSMSLSTPPIPCSYYFFI